MEFLHHRHLTGTDLCFRCGSSCESIDHALRNCSSSKLIWYSFRNGDLVSDFFSLDVKNWLTSNLTSKELYDGIPWYLIFVFAIWLIWSWRNNLLHDSIFLWPINAKQIIIGRGRETWELLGKFSAKLRYEAFISWSKPLTDFVKINVDGSVRGQPRFATTGGVLRDEHGMWISGFTYRIGVACILTAELWAVFQGLLLSWDRGFQKVQMETDSLTVLQKIIIL
ncbi:hypothetical protein REPUB_Repub13aG0277500 [Reevesia pubescens]